MMIRSVKISHRENNILFQSGTLSVFRTKSSTNSQPVDVSA
jgi:hypothetical protein